MHKIYFEKRYLAICTPEESQSMPEGFSAGDPAEFSSLSCIVGRMFGPGEFPGIYLTSSNPSATYGSVCSLFKEVNAAGGLVTDPEGNMLLIRRNGRWDLPKGHQEYGEDIMTTAVREVVEETGISTPSPEGLICVTDHCYLRDGTWHLKHTWWYDMHSGNTDRTVPQHEEGISDAEWISRQQLGSCLENCYSSIKDVFLKKFPNP